MSNIVSQSVDRLWNEFDTKRAGVLDYDEANRFLEAILGQGIHGSLSDTEL